MLTTAIHKVENLRDPSRSWSLQWQTENMAAPAFWYFRTEADAQHEERCLQQQRARQKDLR